MRLPVRPLLLGSRADAEVQILDDPQVAPDHAVIYAKARGYVVRAVGGPLWVNGERTGERRLLGGETYPAEYRVMSTASVASPVSGPWTGARWRRSTPDRQGVRLGGAEQRQLGDVEHHLAPRRATRSLSAGRVLLVTRTR
jgi:hypothetical protein